MISWKKLGMFAGGVLFGTAGIAVSDGAAIAREIADITISAEDLYCLVTLREISSALMQRIRSNYRFIIAFNAALIALGAFGILPPASSALLHNGSTILTGLRSMTDLLPDKAAVNTGHLLPQKAEQEPEAVPA